MKTKNIESAKSELEVILDQLISTEMGRRTFLASVPVLMAACSSPDKTRFREGDNSGQDTTLSVEDEKKLTAEALAEMKKDYPAAKDAELQSYVSSIGNRIITSNQLNGKPYNYNFSVVDVPMVNAFALPAGTIFVTAPLIAMSDSEAELAGVIGHEIGHVRARHTAERMDKAKKEQKKSMIYGGVGGILGGVLGYGLGKMTCRENDSKCIAKATELGAVAGLGGGLLIQKYKFMANSREDEMEADRIGFRMAVNAGYDKDHVGLFYEKLLKMEQDSKGKANPVLAGFADAMSTHPPSKERVAQMRDMANSAPKDNKSVINSNTFESMRLKSRTLASRHKKS